MVLLFYISNRTLKKAMVLDPLLFLEVVCMWIVDILKNGSLTSILGLECHINWISCLQVYFFMWEKINNIIINNISWPTFIGIRVNKGGKHERGALTRAPVAWSVLICSSRYLGAQVAEVALLERPATFSHTQHIWPSGDRWFRVAVVAVILDRTVLHSHNIQLLEGNRSSLNGNRYFHFDYGRHSFKSSTRVGGVDVSLLVMVSGVVLQRNKKMLIFHRNCTSYL